MRTLAQGRYTLHAQIGAGAQAVIWRAWDGRLSVWRAIKVLAIADPEQKRRFEREAHAMARLRHPHILALHDVLEEQGELCLVTDWAAGGSLADWVAREGPMPVPLAVHLGRDIAGALAFAHEQGIAHRDLKPGNLLLTSDGAPLLADFGLARIEDDARITQTGSQLGTPAFCAPEQRVDPGRADGRADVYSLGATLWYLVTARLPWDLSRQRARDWPELPLSVALLLEQATRYEPESRPLAAQLHQQLLALALDLPDPPPLLRPGLATKPPSPRSRRWRMALALTVAGALGLASWAALSPARWTLVPLEPSADRRYARDGTWYALRDHRLLRGSSEPGVVLGDGVDGLLDVEPERALVRRGDALVVVDGQGQTVLARALGRRQPVQAILDPIGGMLLFERGALRAVRGHGHEEVLISTSGRAAALAVSPSGRMLAWVSGQAGASAAVLLYDRQTHAQRMAARGGELLGTLEAPSLVWLDDERLVYTRATGIAGTEIVLWAQGREQVLTRLEQSPVTLSRVPGALVLSSPGADHDIEGQRPAAPAQPWVTRPGTDIPTQMLSDGTLLLSSDAGGDWDVWTLAPDGTLQVAVGGPAQDAWAVASADRWLWLRTDPDEPEVAVVMMRELRGERELVRLPVQAQPRLQGYPPPAALRLACNEDQCIVCSTERQLMIVSLDLVTGELGPSSAFPGLERCALGPDGARYASGPEGLPAVQLTDGQVRSIGLPYPVEVLQPVASDRWLVSGRRVGGGWQVAWLDPLHPEDPLQEIARSDTWLGEPRASPDGRWVAWASTRQEPFSWRLVEP